MLLVNLGDEGGHQLHSSSAIQSGQAMNGIPNILTGASTLRLLCPTLNVGRHVLNPAGDSSELAAWFAPHNRANDGGAGEGRHNADSGRDGDRAMANQGGRICMILIAEQIAPPLESKNGFEVFFAPRDIKYTEPRAYVAAF